jgi:hypothetical protein
MCIACWINKATVTHSEYVTLIAFPQQRWIHERASIVRYTYSALLVRVNVAISRTKVTTVPVVPMVTKCTKVFRYADIFWYAYTKNQHDEVQIKILNHSVSPWWNNFKLCLIIKQSDHRLFWFRIDISGIRETASVVQPPTPLARPLSVSVFSQHRNRNKPNIN